MLEVGCGTGHCTAWLATKGWWVVGLDRAAALVTATHHHCPDLPVMRGDARHLPCRRRAVALVVLITTLEFLEQPGVALAEAARVAH